MTNLKVLIQGGYLTFFESSHRKYLQQINHPDFCPKNLVISKKRSSFRICLSFLNFRPKHIVIHLETYCEPMQNVMLTVQQDSSSNAATHSLRNLKNTVQATQNLYVGHKLYAFGLIEHIGMCGFV